jgi:hypothetical protein
MAYWTEQVTGLSGTDDTATPTWESWFSAQETGDMILVVVICNDATAITIPAGWTRIEGSAPSAVGGQMAEFLYQKHTGSDISAPAFSGAVTDWAMTAILVKDPDGTTQIDAYAITDQTSNTLTPVFPDVTTTTDNCLIFRLAACASTLGQDNWAGDYLNLRPEVNERDAEFYVNSKCFVGGGYNYQSSAGATGTVAAQTATSDTGRFATIAIRNKSGGAHSAGIRPAATNPITEKLHFTKNAYTWNDISGIRTTFVTVNAYTSLSATYLHTLPGELGNGFPMYCHGGRRFLLEPDNTGTLTGWFGFYTEFSAMSLADLPLLFNCSAYFLHIQFSLNGTGLYFEDNAGNWVLWQHSSRAEDYFAKTFLVEMATETFVDSSGSIDWSNIVRFGLCVELIATFLYKRNFHINALTTVDFSQRHALVGGSAGNPVSMRDASNIFYYSNFAGLTGQFGPAANANAFGFDIGDGGTTPTYFKSTGENSFVPRKDEIDKIRLQGSDFIINIKIGASNTCDLSGWPLLSTAGYQQTLSFDAATSTSGTYVTSAITDYYDWICKTGIPIVGANVNHANTIDAKGAAWNSCTITNPLAGASEAAIKFDANGSMDGTSIDLTGSAAGYHIELGASVTAFTLTDVTLSGTPGTDKIHVLATTGTVTITKIGSTALVAADVTSEGATIAVVAPAVSLTVKAPNIIDGSSYQIKNTTTDTILTYGTTSGGTGIDQTYTLGTDYSDGDNIRVRISWHSGTSAKEPIEYNVTAGASTETNNNPITQVDASIYNTYATDNSIDGATLDSGNGGPLSWNNGTMDINVNDLDGTMPGQDIGLWYYYYITTADGIENVFGTVDWQAINKIVNITAYGGIEIFNSVNGTPLKITDTWLSRDDGASIVATASESIQIDPPAVFQSTPGQEVIDAFWNKEL